MLPTKASWKRPGPLTGCGLTRSRLQLHLSVWSTAAKGKEKDGDDFLGQVIIPLVEFNLALEGNAMPMGEAGYALHARAPHARLSCADAFPCRAAPLSNAATGSRSATASTATAPALASCRSSGGRPATSKPSRRPRCRAARLGESTRGSGWAEGRVADCLNV